MKAFHVKTFVLGLFVSGLMTGCAVATQSGDLKDFVRRQYRESDIRLEDAGRQGHVVRRGAILTLNADNVPANALRVMPATLHSAKPHIRTPARHLYTYAPVVVRPDGSAPEGRGEFALPRGTRLAVLEHKVERDRVRLLTHTVDRVRRGDGTMVYGCTEFIFPIGQPSDTTAVQRQIERVLSPA